MVRPNLRRSVRHALITAGAIQVVCGVPQVIAQNAPNAAEDAQELETVIVTGSAIRRVEGETALPVQILDDEMIAKTGAQSVVDLLQKLPTMQGATGEAASIGASTFGFSGVSVHNIGETRTLVLLNGRRLAQFGGQTLTGFAAAIDLNSIPISAIQQVEILTDGASAIYGSDAVAGVVNFITKDKVQGFEITGGYYAPQDGAEQPSFAISGGFGDYEADGYNVFLTVAGDKRSELKSQDRDYADSAIVNFKHGGERWTFFNGSSRAIPGNAFNPVTEAFVNPYLLTEGECPPNSALLDASIPACYFDYVTYIQLYPERERRSATGSLNFKLGEDHNLYVDALYSKAEQTSKIAPVPGEVTVAAGTDLYNTYLAPLRDPDGNPYFDGTTDALVSYRVTDLGYRQSEDEAEFYQFAAGLEGAIFGWDYNFGLTQSESDVKGSISGYPGAIAFGNALDAGLINPFVLPGEQTPEGQAALDAINFKGYWDGGTSRLQSAELRGSRDLFEMNGNPFQFAAGLSFITEEFQSKPSQFAQANLDDPVAGTPAAGGPGTGDQRFGDAAATIPYSADRDVLGVFMEAVAKPVDWLELTGAVRYDDYSDVGDTTNYKVGFKITPIDQFLIRGSFGTGFHAPTVPQLNASPQNYGVTANAYDCIPELAAIAASLNAVCRPDNTQYDVIAGGNPNLVPEESEQATFGFIWEPSSSFSLGADYWWISITDAFGQVPETEAFGNPAQYADAWTTSRDVGTGVTYIAYNQSNVNTGKEFYSGVDFNVIGRMETGIGQLSSQLVTTYMLRNELQLLPDGPYYSNIADYSTELDTVTFRWAGRLLTSLDIGNWSHTLTLNYQTGYDDILTTVDGIDDEGNLNGETADVRLDVSDYLTADWQTRWQATDAIDLTVGVLNIFDEDPPLSLTASNFPIGYDARYYDPRGMTLFGRVSFKF